MLVIRAAYDKLMDILYKGYSVPDAPGRYVDLGMSFKKNEEKKQSQRTANKGAKNVRTK